MRFIISPAKQMKIDTDSFVCTELPVFTDRAGPVDVKHSGSRIKWAIMAIIYG
jgi:hypothetical protein